MSKTRSVRLLGAGLAAISAVNLTLPKALADENIGEIIVTASPLERKTTELAAPVTVIDRESIIRQGGATIGEILAQTPGVANSSFAQGASRPVIRGLDNFRVRLQENGLGANGVSDLSEDHGVPIDPLAAQRIEVIRGPATLRYGSQAIGGIVSVLNNRIPGELSGELISAELYGVYATVDDGIESAGLVDFETGSFAGHMDGFYRQANDYRIPSTPGRQTNADNETKGITGGGSYIFDGGFVGLSLGHVASEYGIPGGGAADEEVFIDLRQTKLAVKGEVRDIGLFLKTLRFSGGHSDYTHDEIIRVDDLTGSTFGNTEWEATLEALHEPIDRFEGAFGFQYGDRALEGSGEAGELIGPVQRQSFGFFLFEEVRLSERARFQFAGRLEHVKERGTGTALPSVNGTLLAEEIGAFSSTRSLGFTPVSGSAGAVWNMGQDTSLGVTAQYVQRAPDLLELFAKGPHEATATFELGDMDLRKEKAFSMDATLKRTEGPVTFELAAFHTSFKDFIFKGFTGLVCGDAFSTCGEEGAPGVEDELAQVRYGQDDARFYGFEAFAAWEGFELGAGRLGLDAQLDFVRGQIHGGQNLPRVTPLRYGGGVAYKGDAFSARLSALRVTSQNKVAPFETATGGYTDLRADCSYLIQLPGGDGRSVEIGLSGANLLDQEQRNHVSFKKDDVLLPGANARFFIRARI